jgi:Putative beta barrel porin-7 (BBP7)
MRKRFWCAVAAALVLAGGARAQVPQSVPDAAPVTQPSNAEIGPTMPASEQNSRILLPIAEWAGTFINADTGLWVKGEYLFTFLRGFNLPPLVTTSPSGTPKNEAGILGQQSTTVLFGGDNRIDSDLRAGFRIGAGIWFNKEQSLGIEGGFLMTSSQAATFSARSTDGTILARPFTDANSNTAQAVLIAFPGSSSGSIDIRANSGSVYGANFDLTEYAYNNDWFRLYSMIGYQYYRYDEALRIQQTIAPNAGGNFVAGTQISSIDNFSTRNEFHGIDLGFRTQFNLVENLYLEVLTKVAVGRQHRDVDINGSQTTTVPGASSVTLPGGVLALSSNSGTTAETDWRAIPQVGLTFCWQVRPYMTVSAGYSFIYFNQIARAAEQVDTTINPNLLPGANAALGGANRPAFNLTRTDMWIQSISLGLEFTY